MKRIILKTIPYILILITLSSLGLVSVSAAVSYTNSKGSVKVVCGSYRKTFTAKKYHKNFSYALNAALDAARKKATSKKIARVTISKGHYKLDRTIRIYSNTILVASGSYFRYSGNLLRNGFDKKKSEGRGYSSAKNITIKGGEWEQLIAFKYAGSSNPSIMHSTFRFAHCNNLKVKNARFKNNYNCHDIEIAGVKDAEFFNNYFYNTKSVNGIANNGGRESLQIDVNTSPAMPYFPAYDKTPCKNISIHNNTFKNKFRAVGSHHAVTGKTYDNITVRNNVMKNIAGIAVYAVYWTNSKVYGNILTDVGRGIDFHSMIYSPAALNFYNLDNLSYEKSVKAVSNSKTYIYDNKIKIRTANNILSKPCGIRAMGDYYPENDKVTGTKAGIYNIYNMNIGVDSEGNAKPNTISGNIVSGIQINYGVNSVVKYNNIDLSDSSLSTNNGVELRGCTDTSVSSNTLKNGKKSASKGINVYESSANTMNSNLDISDNSISNFVNSAIFVNKSNASQVLNNSVSGTKTGLYILNSADITAAGNSLSADTYGIFLRAENNVGISSNTISSNLYGVRLDSDCLGTALFDNTIDSKDECVFLNGSSSTDKTAEKSLTVTRNILNCPSSSAAVRVVYDNVSASIHSNSRFDEGVPYYRFKGDGETSYRRQSGDILINNLNVETTDAQSVLSFNSEQVSSGYMIYLNDELADSITDTSYILGSYNGEKITVVPFNTYGEIKLLSLPISISE